MEAAILMKSLGEPMRFTIFQQLLIRKHYVRSLSKKLGITEATHIICHVRTRLPVWRRRLSKCSNSPCALTAPRRCVNASFAKRRKQNEYSP